MNGKSYFNKLSLVNEQFLSERNGSNSALFLSDTSSMHDLGSIQTTKLCFDDPQASNCDWLSAKPMLESFNYGRDSIIHNYQIHSEVCVRKDNYMINRSGISINNDFSLSAFCGTGDSFKYQADQITAGLIDFDDGYKANNFRINTNEYSPLTLNGIWETKVNDCSVNFLTGTSDHLKFNPYKPSFKEGVLPSYNVYSPAILCGKTHSVNYSENNNYSGIRLYDDSYMINGSASIWAQPSSKTAYHEQITSSIYSTVQTNIGIRILPDDSLTSIYTSPELFQRVGLNHEFTSVFPFHKPDALLLEKGLFENTLCKGLTSTYKKHLDYQTESLIGNSLDHISFYSKNTISRTLFENRFVGLLNGLRTGPDHIGFEYSHSNESQTINIYMIFVGPINGENINIGDHITYINR